MSYAHTKPVVVTRDEPVNGPLSLRLRELGLQVLAWPVIKISPPADASALDQALAKAAAGTFDWITFASQHAVAAVTSRLNPTVFRTDGTPGASNKHITAGGAQPYSSGLQTRIAAVGIRTAEALEEQGWPVDLVPEDSTAEGLVRALAPHIQIGTRVLFPASSRALPTLSAGLRKLGATVVEVEAYRTESAPLDIDDCRSLIDAEAIGAVTFTSPSAVTELDQVLGETHFDRLLSCSAIVALGPTTGRALVERGHRPVLADPQTLRGLAATTARLLQTRP